MVGRGFIELPPPDTVRWVIRRKAAVVNAVRSGQITMLDACARYGLSAEEFLSWEKALGAHGLAGLRTTRIHDYQPERRPGHEH